jgi:hypothetical protein
MHLLCLVCLAGNIEYVRKVLQKDQLASVVVPVDENRSTWANGQDPCTSYKTAMEVVDDFGSETSETRLVIVKLPSRSDLIQH